MSYLGDSVFYCTELGKRGVGDFAWALIAAEHCGTSFPSDAANTPESLLQSIAEAELESGGFALTGNTADADTTAIVLRALAPYRESCSELVERTLNALAELQRESGAFASLGTETAESTAQVVLALSALGIAPDSDERFVKNGVACIDALYGFATSDGFAHIRGGETDALATAQALSALRAYELPQQNDDSVPASAGAVPSLSSGCNGQRQRYDADSTSCGGCCRSCCRCGGFPSRAVCEAIPEMNAGVGLIVHPSAGIVNHLCPS